MPLQDTIQQEVVSSIKEALSFNNLYQRIRPDTSSFITATSKLSLKKLDEWERLIRWEIYSALQMDERKSAKSDGKLIGSLGWLDVCNADGFKRERALRVLTGGAPNSFLLALIVRKLNDWVPQVRKAACDRLLLIAELTDPEIIVDVLFITLPCWSSWGRMGDTEKNILMEIITLGKVADSLKRRLIISASGPVSTIFTQAGRTNVLDPFMSEIAELSVQPSLRAKAYRAQFEGKVVWVEGIAWQWIDKVYGKQRLFPVLKERMISPIKPFLENLEMATIDRSPMVRRIAGEMLIKELFNIGEVAFKLAKILASDRSSSVAERGMYALADLGKRV